MDYDIELVPMSRLLLVFFLTTHHFLHLASVLFRRTIGYFSPKASRHCETLNFLNKENKMSSPIALQRQYAPGLEHNITLHRYCFNFGGMLVW